MAFKLMDRLTKLFDDSYYTWHISRNNDGFVSKREMLSTTSKLTEKQVETGHLPMSL